MKATITLNEAKNKANQELKRHGYIPEEMCITADEKNTAWNEFISEDSSILQADNVRKMGLEDKVYWAIYYSPREIGFGGDAWIFVNAENGAILGVILGE